jgi:hypothetical protein
MVLSQFKLGDRLMLTFRRIEGSRDAPRVIEDRRVAEVRLLNWRDNGLVTFGPRALADGEAPLLDAGQGAFDPQAYDYVGVRLDVKTRPYGMVRVTNLSRAERRVNAYETAIEAGATPGVAAQLALSMQ